MDRELGMRIATAWTPLRNFARDRAVQLRLCLRVTVAALATFAFSHLVHLPLGMWAVLTAVIVTQMSIGASMKATTDYLVGSLGGAVYGGAVAALIPHPSFMAVAGVLAICVAPLALLAAINPSFRVAPITAIIVLLGPTSAEAGPIEGAFFRILEVGLGGVTALAIAFVVLPARAHGLAIDAAAKMLDLMARVLPDVFSGFTRDLDETAVRHIQDSIGQAYARLDTISAEVKRERMTHLAAEPDPGPLLRTLLRLRHDLVMLGRAAVMPLPPLLHARLGPPLAGIAETVSDYLRASADALEARRDPPPRGAAEAALAGFAAELGVIRRDRLTRDLPVEAVERIFALGFVLDQLGEHLTDLERCVNESAQSSAGTGD
jgi:uncharacterized membrane protein YccC